MIEDKVSVKHLVRVKPTLDTPFHIDRGWWERSGRDLRVEHQGHLCPEHRAVYTSYLDTEVIDWVNQRTGEVTLVDGLQHVIREHCSKQRDYISDQVSLVDAIFRVFLANGNTPLSARELADVTGRQAETILRTLSGRETYKGLLPLLDKTE